jgi:hypothetical protein
VVREASTLAGSGRAGSGNLREIRWQRDRAPCMLVGRRIPMKIERVEALHADGGWRPWTFVRIETGHRSDRLGRMQRQSKPVRHRGQCSRPGSPARGTGPAAGGAPVLGHAAGQPAELRRRVLQGHGGHRAGAVGHQGQGARCAGL